MPDHSEKFDFEAIRIQCEKTSRLTEHVIDDFLLHFAAGHHGLEKKMNQQFSRYRHITNKMGKSTVEFFKSQFIMHRVFRDGGLIEKFLANPALDRFRGEERDFLLQQKKVPWRFIFAEILDEPSADFYLMKDVLSGEDYLLFSPSFKKLKLSGTILLWFSLIGFNGSCWQSYGPIGAFQSFGPEEIFFFATEKDPDIEVEDEVAEDIENDPIPYMMLLSGMNYPRTFHKEDEMIYLMAEYDLEKTDTNKLKKSFKSEYDSGVYRFTHDKLGEHPHFAQAYYDEKEGILLFTAMTDKGFEKMVTDFNAFGYNFSVSPYLRVRPQMLLSAKTILKKKIQLNEYEDLFKKEPDPGVSEAVDKINKFVGLVLPDINAGLMPDIEEAASTAGLDIETAQDVVNRIKEAGSEIPKKTGTQNREIPVREQPEKTWSIENIKDPIQKIYRIADYIRQIEPWRSLYEEDVFGVKMPNNERIYFISVMGSNGEYTSLAAYKGYKGLSRFTAMQNDEDNLPLESLLTAPHLLISFTDREDMEKADLDAIKQSGVKFRGKGNWPKFDDTIPGYVPVFPEGETLEDLPVLLGQVAEILPWAMDNPELLYREGNKGQEILMRTPVRKSGKIQWENHYEVLDPKKAKENFKMTYRTDTCELVSKLQVKEMTLQVDLAIIPAPVKEKENKAFFPFMLLLMDKESGMILEISTMSPIPDLHSLYESFPQKLLEKISKLGYRPEKIEFRSDLLFQLAENALKKSWCMPVLVEEMPLMDEALESILGNMLK